VFNADCIARQKVKDFHMPRQLKLGKKSHDSSFSPVQQFLSPTESQAVFL
jgi:hypothetical protein